MLLARTLGGGESSAEVTTLPLSPRSQLVETHLLGGRIWRRLARAKFKTSYLTQTLVGRTRFQFRAEAQTPGSLPRM
uniref:Uncharacterized protein n=1 Tax=Ascaris lumbricoides TaxID=6252 RepID=A0A0M3HNR9_ASCLU